MQNPVECKDRVVNIAGSAGYDEKSKFPYEYVVMSKMSMISQYHCLI